MTAALFFVDAAAFAGDTSVIDGAEGRHAADVRRLRPGEPIDVGDGCGHLVHGVVAEAGRGRLTVMAKERRDVPSPAPRFVVLRALEKGGRLLASVGEVTEVGVVEVVAWAAARSVSRPTDR